MIILQRKKKEFSIRKILSLFRISFFIPFFMIAGEVSAQESTGEPCRIPLVGQGRVVDQTADDLLSLLGLEANVPLLNARNEVEKLVDGDLRNYVTITPLASLNLSENPLISIRDLKQSYPAGSRVGFVVNIDDGLLSSVLGDNGIITVDILNNILNVLQNIFTVRTYLNNTLVGTSGLSYERMDGSTSLGLQEISFTTDAEFDEIELVQTGLATSLLNNLNVYYAFVEPTGSCNDCSESRRVIEWGNPPFDHPTADDGVIITNVDEIVDPDDDGAVSLNLATGNSVSVNTEGVTIPAGSQVGFVTQSIGISILGGISIYTYLNEVEQEKFSDGFNVLGVAVTGGRQDVSVVTTKDCDEIRIVFTGLLGGLLSTLNVYQAFVYFDEDNDGVFDCADVCEGDDLADSDGNGIPDACDTDCSLLNLGPDVTLCGDVEVYNFSALDGVTWSVIAHPENTNAEVTDGHVTGMTKTGVYTIQASKGVCSNVVNITRRDALQNSACNTPIIGTNIAIFTPSDIAGELIGIGIGGSEGSPDDVIDGNLTNYIQNSNILNIGLPGIASIIGVQDNVRTYPAGVRTGFVIGGASGLLDLGLLSGLEIRTYLNGVPQETASVGSGVLAVGLLDGADGKQRVNFITTKPFNAIALVKGELLNLSLLSNGLRIYYAFQEPAYGCGLIADTACDEPIVGTGVTPHPFGGETCLLCLDLEGDHGNPENVTDSDLNNYIQDSGIDLNLIGGEHIIGVQSTTEYSGGTKVGFVISVNGLLNANLLSNFDIVTYLGETEQERASALDLLTADLLGSSSDRQRISFVTSQDFDGVALVSRGVLGVNLLSSLRVYYAFQQPPNSTCGQAGGNCTQYLLASNDYQASIAYERTGITGTVCADCEISNVSNVIDNNVNTYATIDLLASLLGESSASISIRTPQTISGQNWVGFEFLTAETELLGINLSLLNLDLLSNITVTTYFNGVKAESSSDPGIDLLNLGLLGSGNDKKITVSFLATEPFNEIQFSVGGTLVTGLLAKYKVYNAFIRPDNDGDGTPDCMDKCCESNDNIVDENSGLPAGCNIKVDSDADCPFCPALVVIEGSGISPSQTYSLFRNGEQVGLYNSEGEFEVATFDNLVEDQYTITFEPDTAGIAVQYQLGTVENLTPIMDVWVHVYPDTVRWKDTPVNKIWKNADNWTATTKAGENYNDHPIWCTDVTIPGETSIYPELLTGDSCRDITFEHGAYIGKIDLLHYRHAYVEFNPVRNQWQMVSAPLHYMYSADYGPDKTWEVPVDEPKIFMRYFNVTENPDGITSTGDFSEPFSALEEELPFGFGFVLWVNGEPLYRDTNFPADSSYLFPRRNKDGSEVQYGYYDAANGSWIEDLPPGTLERGLFTQEWSKNYAPADNHYHRFFRDAAEIPVEAGQTIMIGNPYMSQLDLRQFYEENSDLIENHCRIWNGATFFLYENLDEVVDPALTIAPMQAFFVDTKNTGAIRFPSSDNILKSLKSAKTQPSNTLKLQMKSGEKTSQATISLVPGASSGYRAGEDIFKLLSPVNVPEIYTIAGQTAVEINVADADSKTHLIPVGFKMSGDAQVELSVSGIENMDEDVEVYLIDRQEEKKYDLKAASSVSFTKTAADNLNGRFALSIEKGSAPITTHIDNQEVSGIDVYAAKEYTTVSSSEKITGLTLFDISGKIVYQRKNPGKYLEKISNIGLQGVFILQVETTDRSKSYKIIL